MDTTPLPETIDWYRQKGESDKDIAALVAMIDMIQGQLIKALDHIAGTQRKALLVTSRNVTVTPCS